MQTFFLTSNKSLAFLRYTRRGSYAESSRTVPIFSFNLCTIKYRNSMNFRCKNFSYAENIRNYFTRNFCYNEYFSDEYLEQSTCAYAMHAVFVALWILEDYGWTHVYPSVLKADRRSTQSERITLH